MPGLGNIPLLGSLFKGENRKRIKTYVDHCAVRAPSLEG